MTIQYLHVIHSLDSRSGGPAEGVKQISAAAMRLSHSVEIVTFDSAESLTAREYSCPVHYLGPAYLNYGYTPRFAEWLRVNASRFSAVVVNGIWQYHSLCTRNVLRNLKIPYYVFTHGMLDPWFRRRYPLKHIKKMMYWPWAEYRVLRDAAAVLFTSEEERQLARRSFGPYRANEIVVNYGIQAPHGSLLQKRDVFLSQFPLLQGKRIILFLSRIHPKKGCDLLIEAFAQVVRDHPTLHLVMAGPDHVGLQGSLTKLAESLGVAAAITWTGMLQGDAKTGAFAAAEAFVLPSHQENFGLAVAEAMACGLPVLISNKVNIWREIIDDHAGLVADDTVSGTTRLLQDWLALSPEGRARIGKNAYRCFVTRFDCEAAARNILGTIEANIASGSRQQRVA